MPADLNRLTEGWLELESDPGLFTLLLEDFGVRGVQVEEVYDLQKSIEGPVYGFIFLFKWIEERRSRRKLTADESFVEDENTINSIFFAQQMVPNSCATHALLSVLLNCPKIYLGPTLKRLKEYTSNMSPENKGYAIGNTPELARAHNSHAKPEPSHLHEKSHGITTGRTVETFHFVSYVPITGRLFELDGLKPYPIDHGPCSEEDWTENFRHVMTERLGTATGGEPYHDVRFNLMAVVPDRRIAYEQKLKTLNTNRQIILEALQQLVKTANPELPLDTHEDYEAAVNKQPEDMEIEEISQKMEQTNEMQTGDKQEPNSPFPKLPTALDSHNYAKSPLMEGMQSSQQPQYEDFSGSDYSEDENVGKTSQLELKEQKESTEDVPKETTTEITEKKSEDNEDKPIEPLTINTSDFMKPLSIQTKFQPSPTPSASSTDTSSEVGSAFNSPVQAHNFLQISPNSAAITRHNRSAFDEANSIRRFVVIRVTSGKESENLGRQKSLVMGKNIENEKIMKIDEPPTKKTCSDKSFNEEKTKEQRFEIGNSSKSSDEKQMHLTEPHKFAPKDLLALLKTVQTEIAICENNLHDEIEKHKKYKIDDCRRTHKYDQFICTFLSMLAEQGKLADLVEQQLLVQKRQGVNVGRLNTTRKPEKRRRSRPKRRK